MKSTDCLSSIACFISAVVLVILNGQPAANDQKAEIAVLRAELAQAVGRIVKLEDQLAVSVDILLEELHARFADKFASLDDELTQLNATVSGKKSALILIYNHLQSVSVINR